MEYTISDKAKKVTLGVAVVGLVLLVIGFFSQKDFVYAEKVNDHAVTITYNGKADIDQQNKLNCLLYTSPSPRDAESSRMPSSA